MKNLTYKQLAQIINELPAEQQNETATFVMEGESYSVTDFMAAGELPEDIQDDVVDTLHEDHFVMICEDA